MSGGLSFAPLVPWPLLALLGLFAVALAAVGVARRARGTGWRAVALGVLILALLDPRAVSENRLARPDVAVVVVDESASQEVGARQARTREALAVLGRNLSRLADLEVRVVGVAPPAAGSAEGGTQLFEALRRVLAEVPARRFAGAVMITDGQVHDVPSAAAASSLPGPLHVLLSGERGETDRRLVIEKAPGYGIVGNNVDIAFRVEDSAPAAGQRAPRRARVSLRRDGRETRSVLVPVGRSERFTFALDHAGPSVVELEVEPADGEITALNNRAAASINAVRDRLKVLLVSGQPHSGERAWRNLLKADPAVDLVHFTILRPPEKDDFTPLKELALIVFPVRELFEVKLHEFDLIVFDRYAVRHVLPPSYLRNIETYLRAGGALLLAVGPEFAGPRSLFHTPLGAVMPAQPTGRVFERGFRPRLTETGRRHPVTAALGAERRWGRWFRQVEAVPRQGEVLMRGAGGKPLLVLDRVDKGRVAQVMSDQLWLWARGFEGGGPQAELLRRLAHWLMKEPDLEEERLSAHVAGGRLAIVRQSLAGAAPEVKVTAPSGATSKVALEPMAGGRAGAEVAAGESGLYRVEDGVRTALAAAGTLNRLEFSDLRATARRLAPVVAATGGGVAWITEGVPDARRTLQGRDRAGRGWIGLVRNEAYVVTGMTQVPLLPAVLVLALAVGGLMAAWWREGS
ncbi:MAG: hypothetical protein QGI06_00485 [Rhodospirillales bacterium]|jgi:hypothetical protein|nr:hypothetical protein [Rhodospirillales bacterium]